VYETLRADKGMLNSYKVGKMTSIHIGAIENKNNLKIILDEDYRDLIISYYYIRKRNINIKKDIIDKFKKKPRIILDSGAFTLHDLNETPPNYFSDYCDYVSKNSKHFILCYNLNVIYNSKASQNNLKIMEGMNLNVRPVFHLGSPIKDLINYCKKYDFLGIGGLASNPCMVENVMLDGCFVILKHFKVKAQALGVLSPQKLFRYP